MGQAVEKLRVGTKRQKPAGGPNPEDADTREAPKNTLLNFLLK